MNKLLNSVKSIFNRDSKVKALEEQILTLQKARPYKAPHWLSEKWEDVPNFPGIDNDL